MPACDEDQSPQCERDREGQGDAQDSREVVNDEAFQNPTCAVSGFD